MLTALNAALLESDPSLVGQITEALEHLAAGEETEADRDLMAMAKIVSLGANPSLIIVTTTNA